MFKKVDGIKDKKSEKGTLYKVGERLTNISSHSSLLYSVLEKLGEEVGYPVLNMKRLPY